MADTAAKKLTADELAALGFNTVTVETEVAGTKYPLTYHIAPSDASGFDVWRSYCEERGLDFATFVTKNLNEIQTQRATQGNKGPVRDAKAETDTEGNVTKSEEDVRAAAIKGHQEKALVFVLGQPREKSAGGITAEQRKNLGTKVVEAAIAKGGVMPTQAEMDEIARSLGIDPASLATAAQ